MKMQTPNLILFDSVLASIAMAQATAMPQIVVLL